MSMASKTRTALTALLLAVLAQHHAAASQSPSEQGWSQLPAILQRIVPPTFPTRVLVLTNFGAIGDGRADCTAAFKTAIQACADQGGGRVTVPAGKFFTGPIHLRSNVELHLEENSEIIFSDRFEDYLPPVFVRVGGIELYNYSPLIYARDCRNIAITGKGRLNGNAKRWWDWKSGETKAFVEMAARGKPVEERVFGTPEGRIRPSFLCLVNCTNILLEDFTIGSGPNWTIHPVYCQNTTIRRVHVDTDGPNNDGIDPDSCRDMLIEDCTFNTGDDCVVLKSGYNEDGWRVNRPTENIVMRRCFSRQGHGGLVIGSEMSGDVRNVFMYDCTFEGTDRAIRIKSRRGRGGVVENVYARQIRGKNLRHEVVILNMDYTADRNRATNEKPPTFRNIFISDIQAEGAPAAIRIVGLEDSPVDNIVLENLKIQTTQGVIASHVKNLRFSNVTIAPQSGPAFRLTHAAEVLIQNSQAGPKASSFLHLEGAGSKNVRLLKCVLGDGMKPFTLGTNVAPDAVVLE
jgi:polygalacturonase